MMSTSCVTYVDISQTLAARSVLDAAGAAIEMAAPIIHRESVRITARRSPSNLGGAVAST